jgi:hypothetical protein
MTRSASIVARASHDNHRVQASLPQRSHQLGVALHQRRATREHNAGTENVGPGKLHVILLSPAARIARSSHRHEEGTGRRPDKLRQKVLDRIFEELGVS